MQRNFSNRLFLVTIVPAALLLAACAGPNAEIHNRNLKVSEGVASLLESDESITLADPRIVCEQRRVTGSNFRTRICMLEDEREDLRESSLDRAMGTGQSRSQRIGSPSEGGP